MNYQEQNIKKEFQNHFISKMIEEKVLPFFYEVFMIGTAYVVGGFFRDFLNHKLSRDIDIIVDISDEQLFEIINSFSFKYSINRHGGIKIKLQTIELDIWSIGNNWAFKNNLVKLNEEDKLHSISKGCFYNYDALVINLHNYSYNLRYYKDFLKTKELKILQENSVYKNLNPSVDANILRAFYLKNVYNCSYSENTLHYLYKKIGNIQDHYSDSLTRMLEVREKYPKYNILGREIIEIYIKEIKKKYLLKDQKQLEI